MESEGAPRWAAARIDALKQFSEVPCAGGCGLVFIQKALADTREAKGDCNDL
jgi:hypothetical protein